MARMAQEDGSLVLAALKAMVAGALQDRMAAVVVAVVALILLLTAWVLAVVAVVLLVAGYLGSLWALATVAAGLVVLALAIVGLSRMRNRGASQQRAMTRALWTATAVNAASAMLRRNPQAGAGDQGEAASPGESTGSNRSMLLILGGVVLILLGFFLPSGKDDTTGEAEPGPEAGSEAEPAPGTV